jgi:phosphate:Na+ symporter
VCIAEIASGMVQSNTTFSQAAVKELHVMEDVLREILDLTESTFSGRDEESARKIEPLVQIVHELGTILRRNHLRRMSLGQCNIYADSSFSNLGVEFRRIAAVCSNVGVATVVRLHPELADHEHLYFESLRTSGDAAFNEAYEAAHARYFQRLETSERAAAPAGTSVELTQT